jgi:hypothetical protein
VGEALNKSHEILQSQEMPAFQTPSIIGFFRVSQAVLNTTFCDHVVKRLGSAKCIREKTGICNSSGKFVIFPFRALLLTLDDPSSLRSGAKCIRHVLHSLSSIGFCRHRTIVTGHPACKFGTGVSLMIGPRRKALACLTWRILLLREARTSISRQNGGCESK